MVVLFRAPLKRTYPINITFSGYFFDQEILTKNESLSSQKKPSIFTSLLAYSLTPLPINHDLSIVKNELLFIDDQIF